MIKIHWLPLTLDRKYTEDMLGLAKNYGVYTFHLSHEIVHSS